MPVAYEVFGSLGVQAGDHNTQYNTYIKPPPLPPMDQVQPAASAVFNAPARSEMFVGREEDLARLHRTMTSSASEAVVVTAVHGLGGIGKSTLAAHYAEAHRDELSLVWWITADTPSAIESGLAKLAIALQPELVQAPFEQQAELARQWLATHTGWLLILDNLNQPAEARALLARLPGGRILITSRRADGWHTIAAAVNLDVLDEGDAVELMTKILEAHDSKAGAEGAADLCRILGCLPLAIEQASAYMAETSATPVEYLGLLARYPATMYGETAEGVDAERTMARVWRVTLDRLTGTPLVGQVLRVLAWYAPDDIPASLLTGIAEEPLVRKALGRLSAYSMVNLTADTIGVHRLVQAVARTPDRADPHRLPEDIAAARTTAVTALAQAISDLDPLVPSSWPVYQAVQSHVRALSECTDPAVDTEELCLLLNYMGVYVERRGDVTTALSYLTRAAQGMETHRGSDHWTTLGVRTNLAGALCAAGELDRAIPLLESALSDCLKAYGPDDRGTLVLRHNLATAYKTARNLDRAIPLLESAVADRARLWGVDHPGTLTARNNLANSYHDAEDFSRAIELHTEVASDRARVLGVDNPATLNSRHNLANAYLEAGDVDQAILLFESIVSDRVRVLGSDHVDTLHSRAKLATSYKESGDLLRAIRLHRSTVQDALSALGGDHPETLQLQRGLAEAYRAAGNLVRATRLYESIVADYERILGVDHPDALHSRFSLAATHHAAGDLKQAMELYESGVADCARVLGSDHPSTLKTQSRLADACRSVGDFDRAIVLQQSVAASCARVFGRDHRATLIAQNNLSQAYGAAGDREQAILLLESVVADSARALGVKHPTTTAIQKNLEAAKIFLRPHPRRG
ncbi:tetratricopeptide repeat protein [Amycolatopsis sp. FBCC-B4732]|uniref:tetratricopeptide repeat protein n=1 Tax=Amycolatopsis sp. FBCC-B4732 TaxID=3079339 RepID=UPI001FF3FE9A|nr:tetratricopeptide repeat protein [Amycolatopsis sp. FBCC-B4732]UOX90353.1 tetratricopeptide repeat protein [Amycolatopsis sp. FBCC-B4732]